MSIVYIIGFNWDLRHIRIELNEKGILSHSWSREMYSTQSIEMATFIQSTLEELLNSVTIQILNSNWFLASDSLLSNKGNNPLLVCSPLSILRHQQLLFPDSLLYIATWNLRMVELPSPKSLRYHHQDNSDLMTMVFLELSPPPLVCQLKYGQKSFSSKLFEIQFPSPWHPWFIQSFKRGWNI